VSECDLVIGEVAERNAELRGWRLVLLAQCAPRRELVPGRLALRSPRGERGVSVEISNLALDLVESLVRGERQRSALIAGVERLHEVASRMHVTSALDELGVREALVEQVRRIGDGEALAQHEDVLGAALVGPLSGLLARGHVSRAVKRGAAPPGGYRRNSVGRSLPRPCC
jgi:hypothetical protein